MSKIARLSKKIDPKCSGPLELFFVSIAHSALSAMAFVALVEALVGK